MVRGFFMVVLLALLLASCSSLGTKNENQYYDPAYAKYYTGYDGIDARFSGLPYRMYYYGPSDPNQIEFGVEVKDTGASFTRGGVFVSGFDPGMIRINQIPIHPGGVGACGLSIGTIAFGQLGGILRCEGITVTAGNGVQSISISSLRDLVQGIGNRFGKSWWNSALFDFSIDYYNDPAGERFTINLHGNATAGYYQHGRLMIAYFGWTDFTKFNGREFLLAGDTYEFPGGEYEYFGYDGNIYYWPAGLDQTTQTFLLTTCYQYTTFAGPMVCIDPEPFDPHRKVCQARSVTYNGGNGGPVAVTSIEQENTRTKSVFRVNVANRGGGTVYDLGRLEKCSPYYPGTVNQADLNVVYLGDVRIGNVGLAGRGTPGGMTCNPMAIRLDPKTGTGSTTCTFPVQYSDLKSAYQTPLVVELWYGYSQTYEERVHIKKVA